MANLELSFIAIVIAVLVLLFVVWLLWWRLPKWQVNRLALKIRDPKARADVEDNFRKTIGQALGGAAVLIGAWQFFQQQDTARSQQKVAQEQFAQQQEIARLQQKAPQEQFSQQQETAQAQIKQQQQAAQALLISNQVSKGFELLAGPEIEKRLGGIYALEAVMNNSEQPQYHEPVLEALCAFVREHTKKSTTDVQAAVIGRRAAGPGRTRARESNGGKIESPTTDVQAALTVIGRRAAGPGQVDLSDVSIPLADLDRADLSDAILSRANLSRAGLIFANLSGAFLSRANLEGADLSGAGLRGADLSDANLVTKLSLANLEGASLRRANLSGAILDGANLEGAYLSGAKNLTQAQLDGACGSADTKLPKGLTLKPCPPDR